MTGCILGKHPEHKFEKASHERTFAPLELIHSDVAGPFPHISMIQAKYALTFTDDFSRYCWVYFLIHNSEVFGLFKVFKDLVENQSGRKIKVLRSDNGGEYVKSDFIQYCVDSTFYPLHTTTEWCYWEEEQITEGDGNMHDGGQNFATNYWVKAINCAAYIQNRVPHK